MGGLTRGIGTTEDKPGERADGKRQDLPESAGDKHDADDAGKRDAGPLTIRRKAFCHAPDRLRHDGNGDDFQPMQEAGADRPFDGGGDHGEEKQENGGWQGKTRPGRQRTERTCPQQPERKPHLAGGGTGKKLAERHEIGITGLIDPFAPHDELIAKVTEMGDGAAEGGDAELQECRENLAGRALRRSVTVTSLQCHAYLHAVPDDSLAPGGYQTLLQQDREGPGIRRSGLSEDGQGRIRETPACPALRYQRRDGRWRAP